MSPLIWSSFLHMPVADTWITVYYINIINRGGQTVDTFSPRCACCVLELSGEDQLSSGSKGKSGKGKTPPKVLRNRRTRAGYKMLQATLRRQDSIKTVCFKNMSTSLHSSSFPLYRSHTQLVCFRVLSLSVVLDSFRRSSGLTSPSSIGQGASSSSCGQGGLLKSILNPLES